MAESVKPLAADQPQPFHSDVCCYHGQLAEIGSKPIKWQTVTEKAHGGALLPILFPPNSRRTVLIVDESDDSRQVLRTVLERRGVQIFEADRASDGLQIARQHRPGVIVMDLEAVSTTDDGRLDERMADEVHSMQTPMVILGSVRRDNQTRPMCSFVPKPYHYGPLVRKIEALLESAEPLQAKAT